LPSSPPTALLVWARTATGQPLLSEARRRFPELPLLAPASMAGPAGLGIEGLIVASPIDLAAPPPAARAFAAAYRRRFGEEPTPLAALSYDSVALTLAAISRAGPNRARIRDELATMTYDGVSGTIRFDQLGGNPAAPVLCQVRSGRWVGVGVGPGESAGGRGGERR
jgi:ABC-type branched-subunit amino acid transport system substrate-binding protein